MKKYEVLKRIEDIGVVAVVRAENSEKAKTIALVFAEALNSNSSLFNWKLLDEISNETAFAPTIST